jgi:hypothetical protein
MKTSLFKTACLVLITILTFSCSKEEASSSSSSSSSTTNTFVKLSVTNASGARRPNYIVMMFDQPVTNANALPTIIKQVTSDASGLAEFDLNTIVTNTSPTTYYFEAFLQVGNDYVLKSTTHPMFNVVQGSMITSSIIVE